MKKKLISFLVMTLILSANVALINVNGAWAATSDNYAAESNLNSSNTKIKVTLENIKEIMVEHSLTMKKYDNNLKIAKENYNYSKEQYGSISDIENDISSTQESIDNFKVIVDENGNSNESKLDTLKKQLSTYKSNLTQEINYKYAYRKAKQDYEKNVETAVYTAQSDYLSYLATLSQKQLQEDTVKFKGRDSDISMLSYENGFISKNDYITSTQNSTDANDKLKSLTNEEALAKTKLCHELGVNTDDVIIEVDINENFQKIGQINYDSDLKTMLENSIDIKEANDSIDQLENKNDIEDKYGDDSSDDESDHNDTINDYNMDNAKIDLKQTKIKTKDSFKQQYNTLMNSYNSIKSSYDKLIQEQNVYESKQTQYDYGYTSKNDVDNAKLTFDTDKAAFIKSRNECYLAYLKYIQMKEGY